MDYQAEIEKITKEREQLAERLQDVLKQKEMTDNLKSCEENGHVWTLIGAKSELWTLTEATLACTRCMCNVSVGESKEVEWDNFDIDELKKILE